MADNNLLKEKLHIKKIRPRFSRQRSHIKRISRSSYRAPKGLQSKMGDNKAGHKSQIKTGFGYPKALRGTDRQGRKIVHVESLAQVASLSKGSVAVVSAKMGVRKKILVLRAIAEKKFPVLHVKDAASYATELEADRKKQREDRAKTTQSRKAAKEELLKKSQGKEAKAKEAQPKDEKAAKEEQKKENDKLLTKQL